MRGLWRSLERRLRKCDVNIIKKAFFSSKKERYLNLIVKVYVYSKQKDTGRSRDKEIKRLHRAAIIVDYYFLHFYLDLWYTKC